MNNIIVISGPSGSGKSTLIKKLIEKHEELEFSVSHTTRPKRKGETEGKDYFFVSKEKFSEMIKNDEFVEWAEVHQNLYGTSFNKIDEMSKGNRILLLDVDVQGARNIKDKFPDALFIFIVPPTYEELRERLIKREHRVDENIKKRLQIAKQELENYRIYDYVVINDSVEDAFWDLNCIYNAYKNTVSRKKGIIDEIIRSIE